MDTRMRTPCSRWLVVALGVLAAGGTLSSQQSPAAINVLKIAAGPGGREVNGTFVLTDERSVFNRTDDREVIVWFLWNGAAGTHKLIAQWRSPDGGQSSNSVIDYVAKDARFGAYWSLPLTPSTPLGMWSIEATVDGLPAGRFTFEVTDRKVPSAVVRRPLTEAELFARLNPVFVVMQRAGGSGRDLASAAGFTGDGLLYTSFAAVDGAGQIRASAEGGIVAPVTSLLRWHRVEDWAVAHASGTPTPALPIAPADAINVGDRCFSMAGSATGGRVLTLGNITGRRNAPTSLLVSFSGGEAMTGAPVVNEFGELIGIIGGSGVPGATGLLDVMRFRADMRGIPVVPFALVQASPGATATPIADLRARGEIVAALVGEDHLLESGFTSSMSKGAARGAFETRDDFPLGNKSFMVFVTWSPKERVRGQLVFKAFDPDGRVVLTSQPKKSDFRQGARATSFWEIPMFSAAGVYRVEMWLDAKPMWRGFVRITP